jgi:hypothetical protein
MVLRISEEERWTGKCSAFTRPYEKLPVPTDLAIVHITLLVAPHPPLAAGLSAKFVVPKELGYFMRLGKASCSLHPRPEA